MFPKQRSSVRLSVRALNRFETALIQRLIALSGSEQMSTSPANPPGYGPPPSTPPKSLHRLSEQLITIARQQSRFLPAALVSARPPTSIPSCASSPPKTPACRDSAYRASVRICFAASTMLTSAGRTSVHFRVLKPRPGPGHKPRRLHNQRPRGDRPQRPPFALSPERAANASVPLLKPLPPPKKLLADKAYDCAAFRDWLSRRGTTPVIPNKINRRKPYPHNKRAYRHRNKIERHVLPAQGCQTHRYTLRQVRQ